MKKKHDSLFKVGGSLLGWPGLIPALKAQIKSAGQPILLLFGGGVMVDLLRDWDSEYHFGGNASHWLAIDALDLIARAMASATPDWQLWGEPHPPVGDGVFVIAPATFCRWDASQNPAYCLPESWMATSDSIALRMATAWGIGTLKLFKSIGREVDFEDFGQESWKGLVDPVFGSLVGQPGAPRNIRAVGLMAG